MAGFADATGRFLSLAVTLNAARVLDAAATVLGVDQDAFARLALASEPGAAGLVHVPYLDGERTPNLPAATGSLLGMTTSSLTPENYARAAVEGLLCHVADALDAVASLGVDISEVLLVGGAARSAAVQQIAPQILERSVGVPPRRSTSQMELPSRPHGYTEVSGSRLAGPCSRSRCRRRYRCRQFGAAIAMLSHGSMGEPHVVGRVHGDTADVRNTSVPHAPLTGHTCRMKMSASPADVGSPWCRRDRTSV